MDLGIEVILELFKPQHLSEIFEFALEHDTIQSTNAERIYALQDDYLTTIDAVIQFLQGKNLTLARQICSGNFLPQASRFWTAWWHGMGLRQYGHARSSQAHGDLYTSKTFPILSWNVSMSIFGFSRYAERLGRSANSFDEL